MPEPAPSPALPPLDSRTLPNGLRVLSATMPHARSATVSFYLGAGSRYETLPQAGISHLVEHCCFKGTRRWPTARQISTAIEGVGGILNASTDRELTVYYAKVPGDHLPLALEIVVDIVLRPLFDAAEMEKERGVILEELAVVEDTPSQIVELLLDGLLWPDQALGRDVAGTPDSVRAITRDDALHYRHEQYGPANALVATAGAIEPERVAEAVAAATADWDYGAPGRWETVHLPQADQPRLRLHTKETEQAHLMIGLPGLRADHPDRYILGVLAAILGDGMSSRLFLNLREELGLAYDVYAYASNFRDTGALSVYLGVDPDNALQALAAALEELARLRQGVPAAELHKVQKYLKGRTLMNMEDTRAVSAWYGGQALLLDRTRSAEEVVAEIEAVRTDDLVRLAETMIREEQLYLAVVGPFESEAPFRDALHF